MSFHGLNYTGSKTTVHVAYCRLATDRTLAQWRAGKALGRVHQERQGTLL